MHRCTRSFPVVAVLSFIANAFLSIVIANGFPHGQRHDGILAMSLFFMIASGLIILRKSKRKETSNGD